MKLKPMSITRYLFEMLVLMSLFYLVFQGEYLYRFIDFLTAHWGELIRPLPAKVQVILTVVVGVLTLAVSAQITYVHMKTRDKKERGD